MATKFSQLITVLAVLAVVFGPAPKSARAAMITETYQFDLGNFTNVTGGGLASPVSEITGTFTATFDPAVGVVDSTSNLSVNFFNGPTLSSPFSFSVVPGAGGGVATLVLFGGLQNGSGIAGLGTDDFVLSLQFTDPDAPTLSACTAGFSCGTADGSPVLASGYTLAADPTDAWGAQSGDVVAIPEPATWLMLGAGVLGLAALRRRFQTA